MLTTVRRRLAAAALVVAVPSLGGCGFGYQTDAVYQPAVGANDRTGVVDVLGSAVVSGSDGSGTLSVTLVNNSKTEPATLTSVTSTSGVTATVVKPVEVPPQQLVNVSEIGAVSVSGDSIKAGGYVRLTLVFDTGQQSELYSPIVNRDGDFSDVKPAIPSASPSESGGASPSEAPSESPSSTPVP